MYQSFELLFMLLW